MPSIVLHPETGQLSRVVESYEQVELAQLEAEANAKQAEVDAAKAALDEATKNHDAAVAAAEDSKSQLATGQSLVGATPVSDGAVPVDVTVADTSAQF